ncbi:unnamed protein product [Caretta caretta]
MGSDCQGEGFVDLKLVKQEEQKRNGLDDLTIKWTHSVQLEDEEEDVSPEEAAIRVIQQHLLGRAEELIEDLPLESEPSSILSSSMATVCHLSKLKQPLELELESGLLQAVLYSVFTMCPGKDTAHFRIGHHPPSLSQQQEQPVVPAPLV